MITTNQERATRFAHSMDARDCANYVRDCATDRDCYHPRILPALTEDGSKPTHWLVGLWTCDNSFHGYITGWAP